MAASSSSLPVLHVWPGAFNLPSIDPHCLATLLCLAHTFPNQFKLAHCTNSDLSPSGSLPFLTHNEHVVASFQHIVRYMEGLHPGNLVDAGLSTVEDAQRTAWAAHAEAQLGNLLAYTVFSPVQNWELYGKTLGSVLAPPQRYFVAKRVRDSYRPRLEAAGLWFEEFGQSQVETDKPGSQLFKTPPRQWNWGLLQYSKDRVREGAVRDKALQQGRDTLDRFSRLLGERKFFYDRFGFKPSTLDFLIAAHILLLTRPPFPETEIPDLVRSYPTLMAHAELVLGACTDVPVAENASSRSFFEFLPRRRIQEADTHWDRATWGWIALSVGSVGIYLATMGSPIGIELVG
ncbi:Tom37 domain-containing protein [Mycena chlorophos]|uniref:Tom37 domain-containing protein n=1 Tax=Mycena chlorophos TaxID=658473 RepID=A0A8H6TSW3_MYCCL|nr:Tom37 domain-containing protein [Mycena chlorophos]